MFRWGPLVSTLLLAALFAGCSDDSAKAKDDQFDEVPEFDDVDVTDDTGAIRGVIVDTAIVPVAGAIVKLTPGNQQTESGESGAFVFDGLEPGTYFLGVSKPGYFPAQQSVDVVAGVKEPEVKKILLEINEDAQPFTTIQTWTGFLQCGVGLGAAGASTNPCAFTGSDNVHDYTFPKTPDYVQLEMTWENTQALGDDLDTGWLQPGTISNWAGMSAPAPIVFGVEKADIETHYGANATTMTQRVFPGTSQPASLVAQQDYDTYIIAFFGFKPREGWSFLADGECDTPEECGA
jgi:hypothetical protein